MAEDHRLVGQYGIVKQLPKRQATAIERVRSANRPSDDALAIIQQLAIRVRNRSAPVRRAFIARSSATMPVPPLTSILRSGRGSAVRLKLYLTLLWIAAGPPHSVRASATAWAHVLGLADPRTRGARQIRSASSWLAAHHLLRAEEVPGVGTVLTLLSDAGTGLPYYLPGRALAEAKRNNDAADPSDIYVRVPATLWTHGWVHALSGPALAMLLAFLDVRGGSSPDTEIWFSGQVAASRYGLSEETRGKGIAELIASSILFPRRSAIRNSPLAAPRLRNVYTLRLESLEYDAALSFPQRGECEGPGS